MDSRLRVPHSSLCQWTLDSVLQSLVVFWFPSAVFMIPKPSIPDSTFEIFGIPDSMLFLGLGLILKGIAIKVVCHFLVEMQCLRLI